MKVLSHALSSAATSSSIREYVFGSFRIDVARRQLTKGGELVPLAPRALDTLLILVAHQEAVDKEDLMKRVWPDSFVSEDSLTHNISVLRRALGDDPGHPQFIATIPRRGYRFVAQVTEVANPEPEEIQRAEIATVAAPDTSVTQASPEPPLGSARPAAERPTGLAKRWWTFVWLAIPAAVVFLIVARTAVVSPKAPPSFGPIRLTQPTPRGATFASSPVVSPDSRHLAFVARDVRSGRRQLWVRALDSAESHAMAGTEGAYRPFWSPDSQYIAFFADGELKRVGLAMEAPQTLASVGYKPSGGSWGASGHILFADRQSALYVVDASGGGRVSPATSLDQSEWAHQWPQFLPDGRRFLYTVRSPDPERAGTYIASVGPSSSDALRVRVLDSSAESTIYAEPGYLLYLRDGTLMAQRFDIDRLRLTSAPEPITGRVLPLSPENEASISASAGGLLAFGGGASAAELAWFDRTGRKLNAIDTRHAFHNPVLSPDDRFLLAGGGVAERRGIWSVELERGAPTRIVSDGHLPIWSPDGTRMAFASYRVDGMSDVTVKAVASADQEHLAQTSEFKIPSDWSRDGRYLVYTSSNPETRLDLWLLPLFGDRNPIAFRRTTFNELHPQVSPDGRWIAYTSDESGRWEVYVESFPMPGNKRVVSVDGGADPQWRRDGRELYYLAGDQTLTAVDLKLGNELAVGRATALFRAPLANDFTTYRNNYDVTADGQRFLIDAADENATEPITVVVNWQSALGARERR